MLNKILIIISLFFFWGTTNSQAQRPHEYDQFTILVKGLSCSSCAHSLEKKFKELKGLKKPVIDLKTGRFTFHYPSAEKMSSPQVIQQVKDAGYTAVHVQIIRTNGQIENTKVMATSSPNTIQQEKLQVAGNCGMCRVRIEQAAQKVKGVKKASWNAKTGLLTLDFEPSKTSVATVAKAIAKVGHDTPLAKAKNSTYNSLHHCCKYR
ncbi:MAG: heavy-metal-associated domain-containing protein [Aureispira sp.]